MAAQCFNCGKGIMYGNNVSHAKNRTKRVFRPNLHPARIMINGMAKKVKLCTKCQRLLKQSIHVEVEPQTEVKVEVSPVAPVSAV